MVSYENRDYDAASRLMGDLVKKFSKYPVWLNNFAVILVAQGKLVAAGGALQQALRASVGNSEVLYNLGCLSVCEAVLSTALRIFRQVVAAEPEHLRTLLTDDSLFRVGVVWAGNPQHANDANRSILLQVFARLFTVAGPLE
ncbi:hypothetical protein KAI46_10140 [bacterium]|nr:hypothetical protein [bacterium]